MSSDYGVWKSSLRLGAVRPLRHPRARGPGHPGGRRGVHGAQPPDQRSGLPDSLRGDRHRDLATGRGSSPRPWQGCSAWESPARKVTSTTNGGGTSCRRTGPWSSRGGSAPSAPTTWSGRSRSSSPWTPPSRCGSATPTAPVPSRWCSCSNSLPRDPNIEFSVMLFAGSTTASLTKSGLAEFEPLLSYSPADFTTLEDQILNFTNPNANRDSTDFIKALAEIYAILSTDITANRNAAVGRPDGRPAALHRHLPLRRPPHLQPGRRALPGRRGPPHPPAADPGRTT